MQKDFHYHCIAVLARAAGFRQADALTIAYASQYVDDSTESEPIRVGELMFDPVRTAHTATSGLLLSIMVRLVPISRKSAPAARTREAMCMTYS